VLDEAVLDHQEDGLKLIWVFDNRVKANPVSIATFPTPAETDYVRKGGHFDPHNIHENRPGSFVSSELIFATYQNAGVRAFDIRDQYRPSEVGAVVPLGTLAFSQVRGIGPSGQFDDRFCYDASQATGNERAGLPEARKTATIRLRSRIHPENPGWKANLTSRNEEVLLHNGLWHDCQSRAPTTINDGSWPRRCLAACSSGAVACRFDQTDALR
jgi:hypothetical protein